uniref:Uncharacterized protein n=1 Tax=Bionectria ochroleuca TaxID=29856 RepID=A0A0B7JSR1_BIOOC
MGVTPQFAPSRRLISTALQLVDPEDTERHGPPASHGSVLEHGLTNLVGVMPKFAAADLLSG